jgi:uncharacterized membrane protein
MPMVVNKWFIIFFTIVSFLGFLDATYLTAQHYMGAIPPCVITTGCETVLTSEHSVIFGVPTALWGAIYYLLLFILAVLALDLKPEIIRFAAYITPLGFFASFYFVYLQFFVIKEICSYCMISATTSTTLFILGSFVIIKSRKTILL